MIFLNLIILGAGIANAIQKSIAPSADNVKITVFSSMDEFASAGEIRNIACDRLIFTEEVIIGATTEEKQQYLQNFRVFLDSYYQDITIISVSKNQETLMLCNEIFFEESNLNICIMGKVKPACMVALAVKQVSELEQMFSANTLTGIQKAQEAQQVQETPKPVKAEPPVQAVPTEKKAPEKPKKGGLFGGFGKKKEKQPESAKQHTVPDDFMNDFGATEEQQEGAIMTGIRGGKSATEFDMPEDFADDFGASASVESDFGDFEGTESTTDFNESTADFSDFDDAAGQAFDKSNATDFDDFEDFGDTGSEQNNLNGFDDFDTTGVAEQSETDNFADFDTVEQGSSDFDTVQEQGSFEGFDETPTADFSDFDTATATVEEQGGFGGNQNYDVAGTEFDFDVTENRQTKQQKGHTMQTNDITPDFSDFDVDFDAPVQPKQGVNTATYMGPSGNNMHKSHGSDFRTVQAADDVDLDLSSMSAYEEAKRPVKIVEREVVKEVVREVKVPVGGAAVGGSKYENLKAGRLTDVFVITGDRRAGATKTALTIASTFSQHIPTLFVDMDIARHGALYYLGLEELVDSESAVQNGLGLLKSGKDIKRYVFKSPSFRFDSIVSMPGTNLSDDDLREAMSQLAYQNSTYKVIVIDCPLENLYLLEELMYSADFYMCLDSDICACSNTLFKLDNLQREKAPAGKGVADKSLALFYSRVKYIVKVTEPKNEVINNMAYLEQVYGLSDDKYNWAKVQYAGTMDNIEGVLNNLM